MSLLQMRLRGSLLILVGLLLRSLLRDRLPSGGRLALWALAILRLLLPLRLGLSIPALPKAASLPWMG